MKVFIDLETYSDVDLKKAGVVPYSRSSNFRNLTLVYITDEGEQELVVGHKEILSKIDELIERGFTFVAHNAMFEHFALQERVPKDKWICTAVMSGYFLGLSSLKNTAKALEIKNLKLESGGLLIHWANKLEGNLDKMKEDVEKWDNFIEYNITDTKACKEIYETLVNKYGEVPEREWEYFRDTIILAKRETYIDRKLVEKLIKIRNVYSDRHKADFEEKYGFNYNSVPQTRKWLNENGGYEGALDVREVTSKLPSLPKNQRDMFRYKFSRPTAILRKLDGLDKDSLNIPLKHFGTMTGRYVSFGVNILNLPKVKEKVDIDLSVEDFIEKYKLRTPEVLKSAIRYCIVAPKGKKIFSVDYSLIEFRVLMWVCKHLDTIKGKDMYCEFGTKLFGKEIKKGMSERQVAKMCVLGLGYGMSAKRLQAVISATGTDIDYTLCNKAKILYSKMFNNVNKLWLEVERKIKKDLPIELKNGRKLYVNKYKEMQGRLLPTSHYGSGFTGNYIQSTAREIIFLKQHQLLKAGIEVLFNYYDEIVGYVENEEQEKVVKEIMLKVPEWLPEGLLDISFFSGSRYAEEV